MNMNVQDLSSEAQRLNVSLNENEKVLEIVTKARGRVLIPLLIFGAVGFLLTASIFITPLITPISTAGFTMFAIVYALVLLTLVIMGLSEWYAYRQSALIITDQRIIDIAQINFFFRNFQTIQLCEVKNCTPQITPGLGQFFHYGTLTIDIIANNNPMKVRYILVPDVVATEIMNYHHLYFHGGVATAHNFDAIMLNDDATPQLANVLEQAEQISVQHDRALGRTGGVANPEELTQKPDITKDAIEEVKETPATADAAPTTKEPATPADSAISLLMFHIPKDKLQTALDGLPAQKEPTINFLENTQYYEVQAIIPDDKVEAIAHQLKAKGAEDVMKSDIQVLA